MATDESRIPNWMKYATFAAWLASMFIPAPFVRPDLVPWISGVLSLMLGGTIGGDVLRKIRGEPQKENG